jgi:hypothetical protein
MSTASSTYDSDRTIKLEKFLKPNSTIIMIAMIIILTIFIGVYYFLCDYARDIVFKENFGTALEDMSKFEARQRLRNKKTRRQQERINKKLMKQVEKY